MIDKALSLTREKLVGIIKAIVSPFLDSTMSNIIRAMLDIQKNYFPFKIHVAFTRLLLLVTTLIELPSRGMGIINWIID